MVCTLIPYCNHKCHCALAQLRTLDGTFYNVTYHVFNHLCTICKQCTLCNLLPSAHSAQCVHIAAAHFQCSSAWCVLQLRNKADFLVILHTLAVHAPCSKEVTGKALKAYLRCRWKAISRCAQCAHGVHRMVAQLRWWFVGLASRECRQLWFNWAKVCFLEKHNGPCRASYLPQPQWAVQATP